MHVPLYRLGQIAPLLGVSVDTLRRHADSGRLVTTRSEGGHRLVRGRDVVKLLDDLEGDPEIESSSSARNHLAGIVTRVVRDKVAAQVELRCGPFRLVSLLTRESVDALKLEPGVLANAVIKATNVVIELAGVSGSAAEPRQHG
jgi:molybdopterin-binding protein